MGSHSTMFGDRKGLSTPNTGGLCPPLFPRAIRPLPGRAGSLSLESPSPCFYCLGAPRPECSLDGLCSSRPPRCCKERTAPHPHPRRGHQPSRCLAPVPDGLGSPAQEGLCQDGCACMSLQLMHPGARGPCPVSTAHLLPWSAVRSWEGPAPSPPPTPVSISLGQEVVLGPGGPAPGTPSHACRRLPPPLRTLTCSPTPSIHNCNQKFKAIIFVKIKQGVKNPEKEVPRGGQGSSEEAVRGLRVPGPPLPRHISHSWTCQAAAQVPQQKWSTGTQGAVGARPAGGGECPKRSAGWRGLRGTQDPSGATGE